MRVLQVFVLAVFIPVLALGEEAGEERRLARGNEALRAWLELADTDAPYLVLDRAAREMRLMHGHALLRTCKLQGDTLGDLPSPRTVVSAHLRRYRVLNPWGENDVGPFDWDERLVHAAPDDGALYFANGLLLCAAEEWQTGTSPLVVVSSSDLRALFNACPVDMPLVVLPEDWRRE